MRKQKMLFMCLLLLVVLSGCRETKQDTSGYQIYRVNGEGIGLESERYMPKAQGGDELIRELVEKLEETPTQMGYKKAIPDGIGITSAVVKNHNLRVDFNGTYASMDHITEVFCRAAVVKTLVQAPQVETVEITVNGQELADGQGNPIGVMNDESFIDTRGEGINSYQYASLTLYFADASGKKLAKEMRNVHYSSNELTEKLVVEELLAGPENEALQRTMPQEARVLDVDVDGKDCRVTLSKDFEKASKEGVSPEAAIYALVNAICDNCGVWRVQLKIEGNVTGKYMEEIDITKPFVKNEAILLQTDSMEKDKTPGVGVDPALQE